MLSATLPPAAPCGPKSVADVFLLTATTPPPAWTSPEVSTATGGAVALPYITTRRAVIESAGRSDTSSCPTTGARPWTGRERAAPNRPASALRLVRAQACGKRRQDDVPFALAQRRREMRLQLGDDDDVEHVQRRQHDSGEERAGVELHHRDAGRGAVDDQQHRGRNQDAETAAGGDRARRQLHAVAGAQHGRQREQSPSASRPRRRCRWRWRRSRR